MSRWGLPMITHLFLSDHSKDLKEAFNRSLPCDDMAHFSEPIAAFVRNMTTYANTSGNPAEYGKRIAGVLCPATLPYKIGTFASFDYARFNGCALGDDVMDVMLTLAANQALSDGVAPDRHARGGISPTSASRTRTTNSTAYRPRHNLRQSDIASAAVRRRRITSRCSRPGPHYGFRNLKFSRRPRLLSVVVRPARRKTMMLFSVLEFGDYAIIAVLILLLAGGGAAGAAYLRRADRDRLQRIEHKLDLILTHLGIEYVPPPKAAWQELAERSGPEDRGHQGVSRANWCRFGCCEEGR